MNITTTTALVTGANRGLGRHLVEELVTRGATVYAASRVLDGVEIPGARLVQLDVTDPDSVARAATQVSDVNLVINNAGSFTGANLLSGDLDDLRLEFETHVIGTLRVVRAFAPQLEARAGTVLNILSALSWVSFPDVGAYAAAKSAEWSITNALRLELAARGVRVAGLHVGYMDTEMARGVDGPKADPADVARQAIDAVVSDHYEVVADDVSRQVQAGLAYGVAGLYPQLP